MKSDPHTSPIYLAITEYSYQRSSLSLFTANLGLIYVFADMEQPLYQNLFPEIIHPLNNSDHFYQQSPTEALADPATVELINSKFNDRQVALIPARSNKKLAQVCGDNGWEILANDYQLSDQLEKKEYFRKLISDLSLPTLPQINITLSQLLQTNYAQIQEKIGAKFVIYFDKNRREGGLQTQFIFNELQYNKLINKIDPNTPDSVLLLSKYITGPSLSMLGCVTQHGLLTGVPQLQLIDIAAVTNSEWSQGVFCGHDWQAAKNFPEASAQMTKAVEKIGQQLQLKNYKGIFGIDFIYDLNSKTAYALECNPRYTGSFPVYTFLEKPNSEFPLEYFHFMEVTHQTYPHQNYQQYLAQKKSYLTGAHLNLLNKSNQRLTLKNELLPGLYKFNDQGEFTFIKQTSDIKLIENDSFLLLGGVKKKGTIIDPHLRFGKLIFNQSISNQQWQLQPKFTQIVTNIYAYLFT